MSVETYGPPAVDIKTNEIIRMMLDAHDPVSDLIFSPKRAPQVETKGELVAVDIPGLESLTPDHTQVIARDLIGDHEVAAQQLEQNGSADLSYSLTGAGRFRVNVFRQRGQIAIVMRVVPVTVPTFADLGLPPALEDIVWLRNGIVLVTGPTGSGKSSTLAAVIDRMNQERAIHIVTIEDPIEFIHQHKKATIHQRELHSDTPTFSLALRAALRQAPKVILVGEMRDRETIEIAIEAAETGHLVMSTLHTIDASKTVERIVGTFPMSDQHAVRQRFSKAFQFIVSQKLLPKPDGSGRMPLLEILRSTLRTRDYVENGEKDGNTLIDAMRDGQQDGMQHFDGEVERMIRAGEISIDEGLSHATNPNNLKLEIADLLQAQRAEEPAAPAAAPLVPEIDPGDITR
jgi:twitching motility protein PilT